MNLFSDLRLAEYVASSSDFPNIRAGFGSTWGVSFQHPARKSPSFGRRCYLFDTSIEQLPALGYPQETSRLNYLLATAKESGFAWLVIHTEASYAEADAISQGLLDKYDAQGWFPGDPDMYHDSGYYYSDGYVMDSPAGQYVRESLKEYRPAIYISGTVIPLTKPVLGNIRRWVDGRRRSRMGGA